MKNRIQIFIAVAILSFALGCTKNLQKKSSKNGYSETTETAFERIKPVLEMAIGCQSDVFDVSKGAEINYASGAKVKVPKDAFVDQDGNPVTGEVKLAFSEINGAASVIASGLPMCINHSDKVGYFESGGMFEINAKQNGKNLKLVDGKSLEIQTMSDKTGNFDFYEYDASSAS